MRRRRHDRNEMPIRSSDISGLSGPTAEAVAVLEKAKQCGNDLCPEVTAMERLAANREVQNKSLRDVASFQHRPTSAEQRPFRHQRSLSECYVDRSDRSCELSESRRSKRSHRQVVLLPHSRCDQATNSHHQQATRSCSFRLKQRAKRPIISGATQTGTSAATPFKTLT